MKDMFSSYRVVHILGAQNINTTTATSAVDLKGFQRVLLLVNIGSLSIGSGGSLTPVLQESDDGTTWADVDANHMLGNFTTISDTDHDQTTLYATYLGSKRYVRVNLVISGTCSGAVSANAVLTDARHNPVNA